ncbi:MAG: ABC transporter permease [Spirochaetota bacterium]
MSFLVGLAWKNLSRHWKRTLITAVAVAAGLAMYIFMDGWLLGADLQSKRNMVWYETGSARIVDAEYWEHRDTMPIRYAVEEPAPILDELDSRDIPATPRITFGGEMIVRYDPFPEDGALPTRVVALDPETDSEVYRLEETIVSGRFLRPGEEGVLMGAWTAEDIGAEIGYPITISTRTKDGFRQTIRLPIVGIFATPNPVMNRGTLLMDLEVADYYLEMDGAVTQIDTYFSDREDATASAEALATDLGISGDELEMVTWNELAAEVLALAEAKQAGTGLILFLVFIIAAVGVGNTMLMAVFERIRELGMMRALGMTDVEIRLAFVMEAAGIGVIGSVFGVGLGALANLYMTTVGFDFSFFTEQIGNIGYRIASVSYGAWNPTTMIVAFAAGIVMSAIIAWLPARKAMKMSITDCLIHQ